MRSSVVLSSKMRIQGIRDYYCILSAVIISLLILKSVCHGQATSSRKVDYAPAVEEFIKQGFPIIKGARYVKVADPNLQWSCSGFWFNDNESNMRKLTGNGFYIPSKDDSKPSRFIFFGGCELAHLGKKNKMNQSINYRFSTSGAVKKADLKKDIALIQKWAEKANMSKNFEYYGTKDFAVAFGFANLVYQMGLKDEANMLFKTLFLNHEDPEKIIDHLVNALAQREYEGIYQSFTENKDWAEYYASLLRIQEKYPRGWENQPGLELLIPQVKSRMDKEPVPSPKIAGYSFTPEVKKLIDATGQPAKASTARNANTSNNYYQEDYLFLINQPKKNPSATPFQQLTYHGMDGFIGLVALIGDETLVVQSNHSSAYSFYSGYHRYSYYENDHKSPEVAYQSLSKPSSRGQIAEGIVRAAMPHDSNTLGQMDSDQFKDFAMNWWKQHKKDSKMELTKHYLQQGNQSHTHSLAMALIKQDTEDSRDLLEKSILSSQNPSKLAPVVKSYVKKRRKHAKDFLMLYKDVLVQKIGDGKEDASYIISEAGGTEKYIASLMRYTAEMKPNQMLAALAKKDTQRAKVRELMEMLSVAYQGKDVSDVLNKFIYAVTKKENISDKIEILTGLMKIMYVEPVDARPRADSLYTDADKQVATSREIKFSKYVRKDWESLLFSEERGKGNKISTLSGMILDKYVNPERTKAEYRGCEALGQDTQDRIIKARSRAMLDGKKIEPLPNQNHVNKERKAKVIQTIKATEPANLRTAMEELTYSEKLVVMNDDSMRTLFMQAGAYIQGFAPLEPIYKVDNYDQLTGHLSSLLGKKPEAGSYEQCAHLMLKHINDFAGVSVALNVYSANAGKNIAFYDMNPSSNPEVKKAEDDLLAGKLDSCVALVVFKRDQSQYTYIFKKGSQSAKEKIAEHLGEGANTVLCAMTKRSIEKIRKERAASAEERKKLIDELMEINPSLEDYRERFEDLKIEQLNQYLQQMRGQ